MISKKAAQLTPYTAGEQPRDKKYIKLNTNENPYAPSGKVISALKNADFSSLRLYPDPDASVLREAAARDAGLKPENVFCGNGSDEVLAFCFQAFYDEGAEYVYFPDVTYSFYPVWCRLFGISYKTVPLKDDFSLCAADYLNLKECQGVVLANPNAPTGRAVSLSEIESIAKANPKAAVVVDEAYVDFGAQTAAPLIKKYENLCVVRTFSKGFSLAGLRAGYALANGPLIGALKKIRDSFNSYPLDALAQTAAAAALSDREYSVSKAAEIIATRDRFIKDLQLLNFFVVPSSANFVFASHKYIMAETLYRALKEAGVLVRWFDKPLIDNFLRISIGTDGEMEECINVLRLRIHNL